MFVKVTRQKHADYEYQKVLIAESFRENGRVKHRTLAYLGQMSQKDLDNLIRGLNKLKEKPFDLDASQDKLLRPMQYGTVQAVEHFFERAGIGAIIDAAQRDRKIQFDLAPYVRLMVINRMVAPKSKLGLCEWFPEAHVPGLHKLEYHKLLRTLTYLDEMKNGIEERLYETTTRHLFSGEVDLVFFDATSTYFEGRGPESLALRGYSRDKRPDCYQVVIVVAVNRDGLPIGHEVWEGNMADKKTVVPMLRRLKERFDIRRCVFVGDRGMTSAANVKALRAEGYEVILALKKRRLRESREAIEADLKKYRVHTRLEASYHKGRQIVEEKEAFLYLEHPADAEGYRRIVCHTRDVALQENARLEEKLNMSRTRVKEILENGNTAARKLKALASVRRLGRYFDWGQQPDGRVFCRENKNKTEFERTLCGKYVLKTDTNLPPQDVIHTYKQLQLVEDGFRDLKSFLEVQPIHHHKEENVRGHIFVCVLSLYVSRLMELQSVQAGKPRTAESIMKTLSSMKLIERQLAGRTFGQSIEPTREQKALFNTLGMNTPPKLVELKPIEVVRPPQRYEMSKM
jgi:transposase